MGSKYTKRYTAEFKQDAVALADSTGRTVTEVARELESGVAARLVQASQGRPRRGPARRADECGARRTEAPAQARR
ncbi:transposase [Streptomyces sp. NPDC001774]